MEINNALVNIGFETIFMSSISFFIVEWGFWIYSLALGQDRTSCDVLSVFRQASPSAK